MTFEVKKGVFVAQWSLARARGKLEGKIQAARRCVMSDKGKILADQVKEVNGKVEELLGLDHDRFMRSVMLAQGQFAKFLTAKPDERAQLLESLTGSDIYSQIGVMAYEEAGRIEQGITAREDKIKGIVLLTDEERERIRSENESLDENKVSSRKELDDLSALKTKITQLEKAEEDREAQAGLLVRAKEEQAERSKEFKALAAHQETIPFTAALTQLDGAEEALEGAREEYSSAGESLGEAKDVLEDAAGDYQSAIKAGLKAAKEAIREAEDTKKAAEKSAGTVSAWLDAHTKDAQLASRLAQFSKLLTAKDNAETKLNEAWERWVGVINPVVSNLNLKVPRDVSALDETDLERHIDAVKKGATTAHSDALKAQSAAKKSLEESQQAKQAALLIQKYEHDRASLVDGTPCSLCGSTHHPYAGKDLKASPAAKIDKDIQAAQTAVNQADKAVAAASTLVTSVNYTAKQLQEAHGQSLKQAADCSKQLKAAGFDGGDDGDALQGRVDAYQAKKDELAEAQSELREAIAALKAATRELEEVKKRDASGVVLPDGIRASSGSGSEMEMDDAEEAFDEALSAFKEANTIHLAATKRLKQAEAGQKEASDALERKIAKSNFRNVRALREARLPARDVERISKIKEGVEKRISAASVLIGECEKQMALLIKEGVPRGAAAEKVKGRHAELVQKLMDISSAITSNRSTLATDDASRKEQKRLLAEIQEEMKEVVVWRRLRELIGSKDGAKFRKFAQSITLRILTNHANKHLGRLNDRYALLLQEGDSLELQIEDYYQAGIRRPLASLSGGESFLASLALALGLSDLAGRSVKIDTPY